MAQGVPEQALVPLFWGEKQRLPGTSGARREDIHPKTGAWANFCWCLRACFQTLREGMRFCPQNSDAAEGRRAAAGEMRSVKAVLRTPGLRVARLS